MARGRRGRGARIGAIVGDIERTAGARRLARAEGRRNDAERLTTDLNGRDRVLRPEGLYARLRDERAGSLEPGRPTAGPAPDDRPGKGGGMAR